MRRSSWSLAAPCNSSLVITCLHRAQTDSPDSIALAVGGEVPREGDAETDCLNGTGCEGRCGDRAPCRGLFDGALILSGTHCEPDTDRATSCERVPDAKSTAPRGRQARGRQRQGSQPSRAECVHSQRSDVRSPLVSNAICRAM